MAQDEVEFKTLDGVILKGTLYHASKKGPGIVMSPGFNCVKEMMGLPTAAMAFQQSGITALLYDPRSTGLSGGTPRNNIDPVKQVEDLTDALTFLGSVPSVLPDQLFIWGMSFAGTVALCTASLDKRAKAVVAVCPLTRIQCLPERKPRVLAKAIQDRESQLLGNPPFYLPVINDQGENPAGFGTGVEKERYAKIVQAGSEIAPNHVNRTTIQTYYKLIMWQPFQLWAHLPPTPVLLIVPELDKISPVELQLEHFEAFVGPKRMYIARGKGHMDVLEGDHLSDLLEYQSRFIHDVLEGKVT